MGAPVTLQIAKRRVATTWGVGAGLPFLLLVVQSLLGHYGASTGEVWSWFLAAVAPTFGLIMAVLGAEALQPAAGSDKPVDGFFLRVSIVLIVVYLGALWLIVLIPPFRSLSEGLPEMFRETGSWLAILQSLVTGAIGVLFVKKK